MEIDLGVYGIVLDLKVCVKDGRTDGTMAGSIVHSPDLYDVCPSCSQPFCNYDCDGSQLGETSDHAGDRLCFNAGVDAIMSFILAVACAGINIGAPAFKEAIKTAIDFGILVLEKDHKKWKMKKN